MNIKIIMLVALIFGLSIVGYVGYLNKIQGVSMVDIMGPDEEINHVILTKTSVGCVKCHGHSEIIGETIETVWGGKEFIGYKAIYIDPHSKIFILGKDSIFVNNAYAANAHPVGVPYPIGDRDYIYPPKSPVRIPNGYIQCDSCHTSHSSDNPGLLVMSNNGSALCLACHDK